MERRKVNRQRQQHNRPQGRKVEIPFFLKKKKKGGRIREQALRDCREEGQGSDESFKTGQGSSAS